MYQTVAPGAFMATAIFQRTHGDTAEASTAHAGFFGQNGTELIFGGARRRQRRRMEEGQVFRRRAMTASECIALSISAPMCKDINSPTPTGTLF